MTGFSVNISLPHLHFLLPTCTNVPKEYEKLHVHLMFCYIKSKALRKIKIQDRKTNFLGVNFGNSSLQDGSETAAWRLMMINSMACAQFPTMMWGLLVTKKGLKLRHRTCIAKVVAQCNKIVVVQGRGRGTNTIMELVYPPDYFLHLPQLLGQRLRESTVKRFLAVIGMYTCTNIHFLLTALYTSL